MHFLKERLKGIYQNNKLFFLAVFLLFIKSISILAYIVTDTKSFAIFYTIGCIPSYLLYFSYIVILMSFYFLFRGKFKVYYLFCINFFVTILFLIDIWYFRGFGSFLSVHSLMQTGNLYNLSDSIKSLIKFYDLFLFLDILVLFYFYKKQEVNVSKKSVQAKAFTISLLVSIIFIIEPVDAKILFNTKKQAIYQMTYSPKVTISNLSPIGYHVFDVFNYIKECRHIELTEQEKMDIKEWFNKKENIEGENEYKGLFKGKNLIYIQVESLENFVINKSVNGKEITPNLNRLLKNSIYFNNYHEQTHNGISSDGDLIVNTSLFPVRRGSTFFRYPDNTYNSLPKILKKYGYYTHAIHSDKGPYWNWMRALYSIGFDKCTDETSFNVDEKIGLGLSDESYLKQIVPLIKTQRQPFYTFIVTLTSHMPFNIDEKYRGLNLNKELNESYLGGYFESIHYTDKCLGMFIDELDKQGLLDNTVVVISGDHEGVHKYYQNSIENLSQKEDWWLVNNKEIPLIVYHKGMEQRTIDTIGGQVDLLPTICYLLGIESREYQDTAMGRVLLNTNLNFTVLDDGRVIGEVDEEIKRHALKGIEISDKIISSNYFKQR
ncbi:LTA synthase family protein [Caloramator sp. ALD01]|uniref:LTA synthase family protein n=1 Tax=Caloramator sp. ALD01 TaxID=1031288 RepID=UPI0003FC7A2D|nr:LTA synthase family protein [Caloramator sp. ALD01]